MQNKNITMLEKNVKILVNFIFSWSR